MSEELEVLKEVVQRLDKAKIAYVISGSIASNYYTVPRMTRDIDIVVEMKTENVERFVQSFKDGFFIDKDMVKAQVQKGGMFNLIHNAYVIKIDFILRKTSAWQQAMFLRRKKINIDHISAWLVSIEDLILAKLSWAKDSLSEIQLKDVAHLLKSVEPIDQDYLNQWIKGLGLEKVYQKVLR